MKFNFNKDYCVNCPMRKGIEVPVCFEKPTNKGVNCPAGRKSNPLSYDATINVLRNGGKVCSYNPARLRFGLFELSRIAQGN